MGISITRTYYLDGTISERNPTADYHRKITHPDGTISTVLSNIDIEKMDVSSVGYSICPLCRTQHAFMHVVCTDCATKYSLPSDTLERWTAVDTLLKSLNRA